MMKYSCLIVILKKATKIKNLNRTGRKYENQNSEHLDWVLAIYITTYYFIKNEYFTYLQKYRILI